MFRDAVGAWTVNFFLQKVEIEHLLETWKSILYLTSRYILYRPVHRYRYTPCFVPEKIPAVLASYQPYWQNPAVSAGKDVSDRYKQEEKRKRKGRRRWEKWVCGSLTWCLITKIYAPNLSFFSLLYPFLIYIPFLCILAATATSLFTFFFFFPASLVSSLLMH